MTPCLAALVLALASVAHVPVVAGDAPAIGAVTANGEAGYADARA